MNLLGFNCVIFGFNYVISAQNDVIECVGVRLQYRKADIDTAADEYFAGLLEVAKSDIKMLL